MHVFVEQRRRPSSGSVTAGFALAITGGVGDRRTGDVPGELDSAGGSGEDDNLWCTDELVLNFIFARAVDLARISVDVSGRVAFVCFFFHNVGATLDDGSGSGEDEVLWYTGEFFLYLILVTSMDLAGISVDVLGRVTFMDFFDIAGTRLDDGSGSGEDEVLRPTEELFLYFTRVVDFARISAAVLGRVAFTGFGLNPFFLGLRAFAAASIFLRSPLLLSLLTGVGLEDEATEVSSIILFQSLEALSIRRVVSYCHRIDTEPR